MEFGNVLLTHGHAMPKMEKTSRK